jgi:pre-mRNA-splicing factor 38A
MANVTDPLARSVHGTNPQNLIEYITRQKIYDSLYWKEECFGLSASDVATKAAELKALGGSYGGNNKPTRFLCLALKLLQIQPDEAIVEEFLQNEDFKYVRALGAFYLRLTGRPAEIYELIEPLYNDFRKLRFREATGWKITYMDELADELLTSDRYCGIALPHLPRRDVLVSSGYLDGPRRGALGQLIEEQVGGDAEKFLERLAASGNTASKVALEERRKRREEAKDKERQMREQFRKDAAKNSDRYDLDRESFHQSRNGGRSDSNSEDRRWYENSARERSRSSRREETYQGRDYHQGDHGSERYYEEGNRGENEDRDRDRGHGGDNQTSRPRNNDQYHKSRHSSDKKYGSLFKSKRRDNISENHDKTPINPEQENTEEYWNEQRAKLGLKPLQK